MSKGYFERMMIDELVNIDVTFSDFKTFVKRLSPKRPQTSKMITS